EEPKDWSSCNCFAIYSLLASEEEIANMKQNYQQGNYGYGHAKQALYELILLKFDIPRERYHYYMEHLDEIEKTLAVGAEKARFVADDVLCRIREKLEY